MQLNFFVWGGSSIPSNYPWVMARVHNNYYELLVMVTGNSIIVTIVVPH